MLGNIFILGDSYSTFEGYIPDGYDYYYNGDGPSYIRKNSELELGSNDVCEVNQTWWYSLAKENGRLIQNCSWSGTTICNTGYNGSDNSSISFIARMTKLLEEGYFETNRIDTFFLFGGTNDSWANAPIGKAMYSDWETEDLYCVLPAFSYLLDLLVKNLTNTKIYCIINSELKSEITEFYKSACERNGVEVIELYDVEKMFGHPTVKGMNEIKEIISNFLHIQ